MTCNLCRHFNRIGGHGGQCWRYPPTVHVQAALDGSGNIAYFNERPPVDNNDRCGEYAPARSAS